MVLMGWNFHENFGNFKKENGVDYDCKQLEFTI